MSRNMSMHRMTKLETQMHSCMAIFHRQVKAGLALARPDLDNFVDAAKEEGFLRLAERDFTHCRFWVEPWWNSRQSELIS